MSDKIACFHDNHYVMQGIDFLNSVLIMPYKQQACYQRSFEIQSFEYWLSLMFMHFFLLDHFSHLFLHFFLEVVTFAGSRIARVYDCPILNSLSQSRFFMSNFMQNNENVTVGQGIAPDPDLDWSHQTISQA